MRGERRAGSPPSRLRRLDGDLLHLGIEGVERRCTRCFAASEAERAAAAARRDSEGMTGEKGPTSFDMQVRRWVVRGIVQGVGFRMFVAGQPPELDQLELQLRKGPPASRVDGVERIEDCTSIESLPDHFTVIR